MSKREIAAALIVFTCAVASCGQSATPKVSPPNLQASGPGDIVIEGSLSLADHQFLTQVVHGDGSHVHQLPWRVEPEGAGVSQDGQRLALGVPTTESGQLGYLVVSSATGAGSREVWKFGDDPDGAPAWNPAANKIAVTLTPGFSRSDEPYRSQVAGGLWVVNADGSHPRHLTTEANGAVAWSPNGKTLAYSTASAVESIPVAGGRSKRIASFAGGGRGSSVLLSSLSWSPDGRSILVGSAAKAPKAAEFGPSEISVYPTAGGRGRVLLTSSPDRSYAWPVYSPDGSRIALGVATTPSPNGPIHPILEIANADGSNPHPLGASAIDDYRTIVWLNHLHA